MAHLTLRRLLDPRTLAAAFAGTFSLSALPGRNGASAALTIAVPALLAILSWSHHHDRDISASFAAGAVLLAALPHQDGRILAVALVITLLQGSWTAYHLSLLLAAAAAITTGLASELPLAAAPSIIMAIGSLEADRRREEQRDLLETLDRAQERTDQAQRINDHIVQNLALASYADQEGRHTEAARHSTEALSQARTMVEHLCGPEDTEKNP